MTAVSTNLSPLKAGQMGGTIDKLAGPVSAKNMPILVSLFEVIRICNMTLANIEKLEDAQQADKDDLIGQAISSGLCPFCPIQNLGPDALSLQGFGSRRSV